SIAYLQATTVPALIVLRIFHGAVFVLLTSAVIALVVNFIPGEKSGQGFGILSVATMIPYAVIPPLSEALLPRVRNEGNIVSENLGNWDGDYGYEKMSRLDMREVNDLKIGEGYLIYGEDVRKFKARYIPPANSVKRMSLMKFIRKASRFLHERIKNAIEETRRHLDKFTAGVYRLYEMFAIGLEEEKIYREYVKARNTLYVENVLPTASSEPYEVFEAMERNRFFHGMEDEARMKSVVERRIKYQKFLDLEWNRFKGSQTQHDMMHVNEETLKFIRDCLIRLDGRTMAAASRK
ncbi:MAG TPA: hypothetical protein PKJ17_07445, partial [Syntrophorhabdaceae bacterium]|nr:hypothetical protein [Syntrophorhabdaceae bacterium]